MAKKLDAETKTPTEEARLIGEADFKKLVRKLKSEESELSEVKGRMGSAVENAVAKHNLHADALRVFRKYEKKNPGQAAEFFLHLQTYWEYGALGTPEDDMLETPKERRKNMKKGDAEAFDEEAKAAATERKQRAKDDEKLAQGTHVIKGGRVVPINGEAPEAAQEAATAA